jgi:hypothetical protein
LVPCLYVSALDIGLKRSFIQIVGKGCFEPTLTDAAICFNGCKVQIGIILRPNC